MTIWAASWQNQQNDLCTQQRLRSAWASAQSGQSSLSAWRKLWSLATHWGHSEDSDQTGQIPRLIWVLAGHTGDCDFVMRRHRARELNRKRVRLACKRPRVRSPRPAHSFVETWSWKHFYSHSPAFADSRRAVVSYWRESVHQVLVNCLGGLPRNSVTRLTDRVRNDLKCVEGP